MGEIASGSWGLCKCALNHVFTGSTSNLYQSLFPRFIFAPKNKMTEDYHEENQLITELRSSRLQLVSLRAREHMLQQAADDYRALAQSLGGRFPELTEPAEPPADTQP